MGAPCLAAFARRGHHDLSWCGELDDLAPLIGGNPFGFLSKAFRNVVFDYLGHTVTTPNRTRTACDRTV